MNLFRNIVYVLSDQTNASSPSLIRAIALAKSNQADLTLLRVLPDVSPFFKSNKVSISEQDLRNKVLEKESLNLQRITSTLKVEFNVMTEQVTGKRYIEIIRLVQSKGYDLVIKEADDIDWLDHLLGRDDMHLLRKCPCPIWLMKQDEKLEYKQIIAAVDLEDSIENFNKELNFTILKCASSLSLSEFTALRVVNIYDVPLAGFISQWVDQPEQTKKNYMTQSI
ncbi:universal stress protein [Alkalimarinus alittae]|uniref:Universal stress protein n=1 Tax=Alkalimarinus alittae TaxID=2961619 RepID=A0ABY6N262_9ALTE|nr:universal stress protein [Alkalimarinus alittae]UZE96144.1 universal stress protein [Alkalimarinus alittae]